MTTVLQDDDSIIRFAIQNAQKDLRYYTTMTQHRPSTSYIAESVHQTFVMANSLGHGEKFVPRLIEMMGQINGVKIN